MITTYSNKLAQYLISVQAFIQNNVENSEAIYTKWPEWFADLSTVLIPKTLIINSCQKLINRNNHRITELITNLIQHFGNSNSTLRQNLTLFLDVFNILSQIFKLSFDNHRLYCQLLTTLINYCLDRIAYYSFDILPTLEATYQVNLVKIEKLQFNHDSLVQSGIEMKRNIETVKWLEESNQKLICEINHQKSMLINQNKITIDQKQFEEILAQIKIRKKTLKLINTSLGKYLTSPK